MYKGSIGHSVFTGKFLIALTLYGYFRLDFTAFFATINNLYKFKCGHVNAYVFLVTYMTVKFCFHLFERNNDILCL